ncbi:glycosyltransferase family 4 protein [Lutibacter sp. B1]|nr:glycosyltransferase family 4 protein [Lutibacter sp. B1]
MMAVNIANALAERGVNSHICATRLEGNLKLKVNTNVGYLFLNKKRVLDMKAIKKLNSYLKKNDIKLIHAHSTSYFIAFLVKLINPKIKIIWHNHYGNNLNMSFEKATILKVVSFFFQEIISVNENLHIWSCKNLNSKKNSYIPNFASLDIKVNQTKELKGVNQHRIICLANLREEKDHLNLLRAFKIVQQRHNEWTLHLVGADFNDEYSEKIKNFIKSNNLGNHVFLYGSCSDVEFILKQSTIGVLSSKSEGLPVSLLEYGLSKLPVVVTNVGDCDKVVVNNDSGLVVKPKNEFQLAEAIDFLIKNNNKRIQFGTKLNKRIINNYSKNNYINKLISIYN